jgi:hypothetical protein
MININPNFNKFFLIRIYYFLKNSYKII